MIDLTNKTAKERASLKADEVVRLAKAETFERNGYTVEIQSIRKDEKDAVEVFARAWKDGKQLGFGSDGSVDVERFRFVNPPINVPDGTTRKETDEVSGKEYDAPNFKEDAGEALRLILADTIRITAKDGSNIIQGKYGSTVTTVYPSSSNSIYSSGNTWATQHDAASGTTRGTGTSNYIQACVSNDSGPQYVVERFFATLDTSGIPDTDTISGAVFSIYTIAWIDIYDTWYTSVYNSSHSDTVVGGDFDLGGTTDWSTDIRNDAHTTSAYNDYTLNAAGIAGINVTGNTKLCLRDRDYDVADSAPTNTSANAPLVQFASLNTTGDTQDPKLVVTHAAAASATGVGWSGAGVW